MKILLHFVLWIMPRKKAGSGEDTRGLKAKAQKAASAKSYVI